MTGSVLQQFYNQYYSPSMNPLYKSVFVVLEPFSSAEVVLDLVGTYGNTESSSSNQSIDVLYQHGVDIIPVVEMPLSAKYNVLRYFLTNDSHMLNGLLDIVCDIEIDLGDPQGNSAHLIQIAFEGYGKSLPLLTQQGSFISDSTEWSIIEKKTDLIFDPLQPDPIIFQRHIASGEKGLLQDQIKFTVDVGYLLKGIYADYASLTTDEQKSEYLSTALEGIQFDSSMKIYATLDDDFKNLSQTTCSDQTALLDPIVTLASAGILPLNSVTIGRMNDVFVTSGDDLGMINIITESIEVSIPLGTWTSGDLNQTLVNTISNFLAQNTSLGLSIVIDDRDNIEILSALSTPMSIDHIVTRPSYGFSKLSYTYQDNEYHSLFNINQIINRKINTKKYQNL
jgi:hypothetical protein